MEQPSQEVIIRNAFWSPDYITGIDSFLALVKQSNDHLSKEIVFYRNVNLNCFGPLLKGLDGVCQNDKNDSITEMGLMNDFLQSLVGSGISDITSTCIKPLTTCLNENKLYYNDVSEDLYAHYNAYSEAWKAAKEAYLECQRLANIITNEFHTVKLNEKPIELTESIGEEEKTSTESTDPKGTADDTTKPPGTTTETTNNDENITSQIMSLKITYPYKLDEMFIFENEDELIKFLTVVKEKTTLNKSFMSMLGTPKEYFDGQSLLNSLKKIDSKLDTSLYNLSRICQTLLTEYIIQEYQNVGDIYLNNLKSSFVKGNNIDSSLTFQLESYYIWNPILFNKDLRNNQESKQNKPYGDLTNKDIEGGLSEANTDISRSLSNWFRKVSGTTEFNTQVKQVTSEDISETSVKLSNWEDVYFERYQKLQYSRVQLEKLFYTYCMKYEKFDSKTNQVLHTASTTFQNSMCRIMNRNETNPLHLISLKDRIVSHSPIGYFARDNSIPFTKWIVNKENREVYSLECVFGCNQITDDMVNVIESIIVYIESQITEGTSTRDQIFQYWKDDIDFIRSSNIERDFVKEFKEMTNNHNINTNTVKLIIEKTRIGSKYILKDWVDLLKILLLEMPDSVVPITLQQEFSQQKEYEWLEMISIEKLKILEIFANHFNQIGDIDLLFKDQRDIPFIQFFSRVRGFGQNIITSTSTISNIVLRLLKDHIKDITSAINNKKIKKPENENQVPMITVNRERSNSVMQGSGKTGLLKSAALTLPSNNIREHKRSISMTVLSSGLKTLVHEGKEEGDSFVPLPFKTTSTPGSPSQLTNAQKRKSGLNLLTPSTENLD